jgi:crotonobetainyl-CoA:carnitine CoA-transferase CaiB-like acyl-CoA transferase
MWAGPLCAHLLSRAGAEVVKVEDPDRPDTARDGDSELFAQLHRGQRSVTVPFATADGVAALGRLLETADVVIEGSRPRALAALGFGPERFCATRAGRTWVSITGHGRVGPRSNWVAFGDDAAAGGGLVAAGPDGPVFCGDAIADPVTGLYAATAALASIAVGGGHLVDCALSRAAAYANGGPGCPRAHRLERSGDGWVVSHTHGGGWAEVRRPIPRPTAAPGPAA